jgi:diaminopimelate decarboxylase
VVVDAGMNDLASAELYGSYHAIWRVHRIWGDEVTVDVVGPICESGDFLAKDRKLPRFEPGIDGGDVGGRLRHTMSSNYNARPGHLRSWCAATSTTGAGA